MAGSASLDVAAIVFAESKRGASFTAADFSAFCAMAGEAMDEEQANEILVHLAECKSLREIGPGVYAAVPDSEKREVPLEHPLWPEEARQ